MNSEKFVSVQMRDLRQKFSTLREQQEQLKKTLEAIEVSALIIEQAMKILAENSTESSQPRGQAFMGPLDEAVPMVEEENDDLFEDSFEDYHDGDDGDCVYCRGFLQAKQRRREGGTSDGGGVQ